MVLTSFEAIIVWLFSKFSHLINMTIQRKISHRKEIRRAPEVHKEPGRVQGLPARVGNRGGSHHHHHFDIFIDDDHDHGNDDDDDHDDNDDDDDDDDDDNGDGGDDDDEDVRRYRVSLKKVI